MNEWRFTLTAWTTFVDDDMQLFSLENYCHYFVCLNTNPGLRQDGLSLSFLGRNHWTFVCLASCTELSSKQNTQKERKKKRKRQLKTNRLMYFTVRHVIVSPSE